MRSAIAKLLQILVPISLVSVPESVASGSGLLFPFGADEGDSFLPPNDDGSSGEISISLPFPFFGHDHDSIYVNTNGVLSFDIEVPGYTPESFPLDGDRRVMAVFWGDINTEFDGSIGYRQLQRIPANEELFVQADAVVRQAFIDQSKFTASWMLIATWYQVPFFGYENGAPTNTFQAVLLTDGKYSFAMYNYEEILWTTGTFSGGDSATGLGGTPAQVGFNAGDGSTFYAVPESQTDAIADIDDDSNIGTPGRFLFRVESSDIVGSGCDAGGSLAVFPVAGSMLGGDVVHLAGPCLEVTSSIVCSFAGVQVAGEVVSSTVARCITPAVFEVGRLPLTMSTDGGKSFNSTGIFTYLSSEDTTPLVTRLNSGEWHEQESVTITWDTEALKDYVEYVQVSVYAYVEDFSTGEVELKPVYNLPDGSQEQMVLYNASSFSFPRPQTPEGVQYTVGAVRVSQYTEQGPGNMSVNQTLPGMWSDIHNLHWLYRVPDSSAWCQNWLDQAGSDLGFLNDTEPCPCTLSQALFDAGRFSPHPFCNADSADSCGLLKPGAVHCVRADTASDSGGGQECCYGNDGNVLDVARTTGGGFAQRRHHGGVAPYKSAGRVPYLSHWVSDILPMEHCCVFSDSLCDEYKSIRPSQTCDVYSPPTAALGAGDPHIITVDGVVYTFNGVGEYTMLETCNGSLVLQARMAVLQPGDKATVITALAAVDAGKSDQIFVEVSESRGMDVWFRKDSDGSEWSMLEIEETQIRRVELEGVTVTYREDNSTGAVAQNVRINFNCGVSLVVTSTPGLLNVLLLLEPDLKGRTRGQFGNWNGNATDDLEAPDGTVLPVNSTAQEIHSEFGQKWQIKPEDSLFRYPSGKGPSDYSDESFAPDFISPDDVIDASAYEICGNDTRCAFDFAVTGNEAVARATKDAIAAYHTGVQSGDIVTCGGLSSPTDGKKEVSRANVGGVASFSCDEGYNLEGDNELMCQENGTWSGGVPTCVADPIVPVDDSGDNQTCGALTTPSNGQTQIFYSNITRIANFSCDEGFILQGESELVCQENGTWSGDVPTCVADPGVPINISSGLELWQLAVIITGSCVAFVTVAAVLTKIIINKARAKVDMVQEIHIAPGSDD